MKSVFSIALFVVLLAISALSASAPAHSAAQRAFISAIEVAGNQRVDDTTILRYAGLEAGKELSVSDVNRAVKALYQTGFFAEVTMRPAADRLIIEVLENPVVNRVLFEGNEKLESEQLKAELQLQPRSIYTRPKIQADTARLLSLYRKAGRFSAEVEPTLVQLERNRVDVIYEIKEGGVTKIGTISFIGNKQFSASTLRDVITTRTECWYCILTDNDKYDQDRVAYDKELLRRFYTKQGYADFDIKAVTSELSPEKDAFFITYTLEEGIRYDVDQVSLDSKLPGADADELLSYLDTETGELYDSGAVESSIDNLVNELGDRGFAFVDVDPKLTRHEDREVIDIAYQISEGPRVYIERINIEGNVRTLDEVIRREFRVVEGDPYSTSKLQRSEQRLRNLGFFEDVTIDTARGSAPDKIVINVAVAERSTGEVTLGAGFSSEDGALADFGIRERNLLGRGQDLRLRATLAAERQQIDIGFTEPYFLGRDVRAGFDVFQTSIDQRRQSSFDRETQGGRLRFGYALTENLRQDLFYSYQETNITNVDSNASRFIRDQIGENITSMVGQTLTLDKLDNRLDPTSGYLVRFDLDVAGLGGDSEFIRPELRSSYYYSIAPQWTWMIGGSAGYVHALNDRIQIQDRFFLGSRDMRGFDDAGIGPRDVTTGDALGGNTFYTATTELQFPLGLPDDLGFRGAVFVDGGSLFDIDDDGPEVADERSIRGAAGFGIAWASPFGPVRIDFAQAFLKEEQDVTETFRLRFGNRF